MIKDIEFPKITDVSLAIFPETNELGTEEWGVYIINSKPEEIYGVLINAKGYGTINKEEKQTTVMRHFFEKIPPKDFQKIELIQEELFQLTNEFWVSFYHQGTLYDKKYIFLADTIEKKNFTQIPIINKKGIFHP